MLKRHEVEILLKVGHSKAEVARLAAAILDRVLERGRFIHLDGPSGRTRHLNLEETLPENTKRLRISGIGGPDFPEPTPERCRSTSKPPCARIDRISRVRCKLSCFALLLSLQRYKVA